MTPLNRLILMSRPGRWLDYCGGWLWPRILRLFHFFGLVKYNREIDKITIERAKVLWAEAKRRGIAMESIFFLGREVDHYRAWIEKKLIYFNGLPRKKNSPAMLWMDDKAILKEKLLAAGIPAPRGGSFSNFENLKRAFAALDKPVIIKPRLGSRGRHSTTNIFTEAELKKAFARAKQLCHWVMLEEHLDGGVYRGTVIGGRLAGVIGIEPPRVTGDGVSAIVELIAAKNKAKDHRLGDIPVNPFVEEWLVRQGYGLATVLPLGKIAAVNQKMGVDYGGDSFEITGKTHPDIKAALEKAARLVNDEILGFDFIIRDAVQSPQNQKWGIIECNGLPFINLHYHPWRGESNNVARQVWDQIVGVEA